MESEASFMTRQNQAIAIAAVAADSKVLEVIPRMLPHMLHHG
jgi:hypothetical protein